VPTIDPTIFTPYSSVNPLTNDFPNWVSIEDSERLAAYLKYDQIYWSFPRAFRLSNRGTNNQPIIIPSPRMIVDTTSHYLLKGLQVSTGSTDDSSPLNTALKAFLKREKFYSLFHNNKHAGVCRGDYIFHMMADPRKPEGKRVSLLTVNPGCYFRIEDEFGELIGVRIAEQYVDPEDPLSAKKMMRVQQYTYVGDPNNRRVTTEEAIYEQEGWWKGQAESTVIRSIRPVTELPESIRTIPVYHFKNIDWQDECYGASEIRGFEFLAGAIDQSISDEDIALALDGLGVYNTDAPPPTDKNGNEVDWEVAPGIVLETPPGTTMKRVDGVGSVKPSQDHLAFMLDQMYETSATFRTGQIDALTAESGIALALKFLPTLAKLEERDDTGIDLLTNMFFDWKLFYNEFEDTKFSDDEDEIKVEIGQKLPQDRVAILNELNNMMDRGIISRKYYRVEMKKLGYEIPENMNEEVLAEERELTEARQFAIGPDGGSQPGVAPGDKDSTVPKPSQSNNTKKTNESDGTEATQKPSQQTTPKK
jgi:hypothetical protein